MAQLLSAARNRRLALLSGVAFAGCAVPASAQDAPEPAGEDSPQIIVTGTRQSDRSAADTVAPVDVVSGTELQNQAPNNIGDAIRLSVPSYNVSTQPISDAATLVRPANLRGLSPDNTLVLINGKRMHRAAVIAFLGGGISDGSQGPDVSVIPSIAIKQLEVLRDTVRPIKATVTTTSSPAMSACRSAKEASSTSAPNTANPTPPTAPSSGTTPPR